MLQFMIALGLLAGSVLVACLVASRVLDRAPPREDQGASHLHPSA